MEVHGGLLNTQTLWQNKKQGVMMYFMHQLGKVSVPRYLINTNLDLL